MVDGATVKRRQLLATFAAGSGLVLPPVLAPKAWAQSSRVSDGIVKIGVLSDLGGPYRDFSGPGSLVAAHMAVEDFGGTVLGKPIEITSADHQNKPDVGSAIAREWFSVGQVDMITDLPNSAVALAVQQVARDAGRVCINSSAATTELTGKSCAPFGMHWTADGYALVTSTVRALVRQGLDTWFFLTVDNAGGYTMEDAARPVIQAEGGKIVAAVRHPLNTSDFSSYLLQAQASGAKVVALANAGNDLVNTLKQAAEFGLTSGKQHLAGMFVNITDIHSLGLAQTQGLTFTDGFYWDLDEQTRAFSKRFQARHKAMPTQYQAGVYSAVAHYLKAIQACGTDEAGPVVAQMQATPVEDFFSRNGHLRPDGRMVHDMYMVQAKTPAASQSEWDLLRVMATIPGDEAFRSLAAGNCKMA